MTDRRVTIYDTTLRDGEQAPGCSMTVEEKLRFARKLESLGVDIIEAGFPVASAGDFEAVQRVSGAMKSVGVSALARCRQEDITLAWNAVRTAQRPRIHTFLATSDIHLTCKLKMTRDEAMRQIGECIRYARSLCPDVQFSPEDATRTEPEFLCKVLEIAIEAGATTLNIPDTVGYTTPGEYAELMRAIRTRVKGIESTMLSVHCHNDLGLAVANTLAGVEAGARQVECTMNGIGERAGNAALEEVAMAIHVRNDRIPFETGIRHSEIYSASHLLSDIVGFQTQPNKAIVGRNAFAHEAGIHQHGVISNPLCYEIMTPESVGVPVNNLVLGKHSGRHALLMRFEELGYPLNKQDLQSVYERFIQLADRKKKIYDQDLISLLMEKPVTPNQESRSTAYVR